MPEDGQVDGCRAKKKKRRVGIIVMPRPQMSRATIVETCWKQWPGNSSNPTLCQADRGLNAVMLTIISNVPHAAASSASSNSALSPHLEDHQSPLVLIPAYVSGVSKQSSRYIGRVDRRVATLLVLLCHRQDKELNAHGKEARPSHCGKFASSDDAICATQPGRTSLTQYSRFRAPCLWNCGNVQVCFDELVPYSWRFGALHYSSTILLSPAVHWLFPRDPGNLGRGYTRKFGRAINSDTVIPI